MKATQDTAPTKPENSSNDDEGRGDNPGVGGLPAEGTPAPPKPSSDTKDSSPGDNPGVGGCPVEN